MSTSFDSINIDGYTAGNGINVRVVTRLVTVSDSNWQTVVTLTYTIPTLTINGLIAGTVYGQIDGIECNLNDRILIKDAQTALVGNATLNGIWLVTGGTPTSLQLVRAQDLSEGDTPLYVTMNNRLGVVNAGTSWICTLVTGTGLIDNSTTSLYFTQSGLFNYASGSLIYANTAGTLTSLTLPILSNEYAIVNSVSGPAWGKINLANTVTGILPVTNGGTGLNTLGATNQILGVNISGTSLEYKTLTAGTGINITNTTGTVTIVATNNTVLDTAATPTYPTDLTKGVWHGLNTKANAFDSTCITLGQNAATRAINTIAIGGSANAPTTGSLSIGYQTLQNQLTNNSINTAIGYQAGTSIGNNFYTTGTASQTTTTITGSGTAWFADMQGGVIVFNNGTSAPLTTFVSATVFTSSVSQSVSAQGYTIYYGNTGGTYTTGTITQAGTNVTGAGTTFTQNMVGGYIIYRTLQTFTVTQVTGYTNATTLTVANSQTVSTPSTYYLVYSNPNQNTFIGYQSGNTCTTGAGNVAIGHSASVSRTVTNSTAIGVNATTSSNNSVAIGQNINANQTGGLFVQHRGPSAFAYNPAGFIAGTNELVEITSSRKNKCNIRNLEEVSVVFDQLRPVRYNAIDPLVDGGIDHIGFIAEEVNEIYPEFVTKHSETGEISGLMTAEMVAVLVKEVQSCRQRIASLEDQLKKYTKLLSSIDL